jgi:hypothetical protein
MIAAPKGSGLGAVEVLALGMGGGGIDVSTGLGVVSIFVAVSSIATGVGKTFVSILTILALRSFRLLDSCCTRRNKQLT